MFIDFNPINASTGKIDPDVIGAVRDARNNQDITGFRAAVLVAAVGLFEVALDRDRSFAPEDAAKYNAWFAEHLVQAGLIVTKGENEFEYIITQDEAVNDSPEAFADLPILRNQLFASIAKSFAYRPSRKQDIQLITRRISFTETEKHQQMDRIIIAMANQENFEFDPNTDKFTPMT